MDAWLILLIGGSVGLVAGAVIGYARSRGSGRGPGGRDVLVGAVVGAMVGLAGSGVVFSEGRSRTSAADLDALEKIADAREFDKRVLRAERPVLVDFFATWCGPCKRLAPTIRKLSEQYAGRVDVVKIDGDLSPGLMRTYGVEAYPTVLVFSNGSVFGKPLVGVRPAGDYRAVLDAAIAQTDAKTERKAQ